MKSHGKRLGTVLLAVAGILTLGGFTREFAGGICVSWTTRTPHYSVNLKGSTHLSGQSQFTAVENAFTEWSTPTCTDMAPVDDGTTPRSDITYNPDAGTADPNVNLIVWRPQLCSAVVPHGADGGGDGGACEGTTSCDDEYDCLDDSDQEAIALTTLFARTDTGGILQAGTELNDFDYVFTTATDAGACDYGCDGGFNVDGGVCGLLPPTVAQSETAVNWPCIVFDVQDIMTHEAGHFLGFGESTVSGAVMATLTPAGDDSKRILAADDQSAVCTIYPKGAATPSECDAGASVLPKAGGCGCSPGAGSTGGSGIWIIALGCLLLLPLTRRRSRQ